MCCEATAHTPEQPQTKQVKGNKGHQMPPKKLSRGEICVANFILPLSLFSQSEKLLNNIFTASKYTTHYISEKGGNWANTLN